MSQYSGKLTEASSLERNPKAQKKRPPRIGNYITPHLYLREDGRYQWYGVDQNKILVPWGTSFAIHASKDTPKVTRRKERDKNFEQVKAQIRLRDKRRCINCGEPTCDVHHFLTRNSHPNEFNDKRFLGLLCRKPQCHGNYANTLKFIGKMMQILKARHAYTYPPQYDYYFDAVREEPAKDKITQSSSEISIKEQINGR